MTGTWIQDLRFGLRMMGKAPFVTGVAVVTLSLGIGANTAIFSVVNAVLLKPLPYRDAEELVMVWSHGLQNPEADVPVSYPVFQDWRRQGGAFEGMAAFAYNRFLVSGKEGPDETRAVLGSPDLFAVLGARPALGRPLLPSDERDRVAVLGHGLWMRRYDGDPGVVGRTIILNDEAYTIVGVMPPGFRFPSPDFEIWLSFALIHGASANPTLGDWIGDRTLRGYRVVARLKDGASFGQAEAEMHAVARRLAQDHPDSDANFGVHLTPLREQMLGDVRLALLVLQGAIGLILLIACANVANLMLARISARGREMAVRSALGAPRSRLVRQLLTESALLAFVAGVAGLLLARWGLDSLIALAPATIPGLDEVAIDGSVLAFTALASLLTSVVFGLAPATQVWTPGLSETLKKRARDTAGGRSGRRARSALMVAETAIALVLLIGAGLMIRSFAELTGVDAGFDSARLLTMSLGLSPTRYPEPQRQVAFFREIVARIEALPGVRRAGASTSMPPTYIQRGTGFTIEGRPQPPPGQGPAALYMPATSGFLTALGVPLRSGRHFTEADDAGAPAVVIVNETLARQHFPGEDPVGLRLEVDGALRAIVGVVGDVKYRGLSSEAGSQIYAPYAQSPFPGMYLVVRAASDPLPLVAEVRRQILAVDPDQPPMRIGTMDQVLSDSVAQPRFETLLLSVFGGLAAVLAAAGIYGVMAWSVAQRTREIGVRVALGARRADVVALVLRQGMTLTAVGLLIGLAGALGLTRLLSSLLFEVSATDPLTFAAVPLALAAVALLACYVPARRAAGVDPMTALRAE